MSTATFYQPPLEIYWKRYTRFTFDIYDADGETPLAIESGDNVRFKVWATDGATPAIECESATPGSGSYVEVVSTGTSGSVPARVTVHLLQTDTDDLTVGTQYYGELLLVDDSDSDRAKPLARMPLSVIGMAAGDITL